MIVMNSEKNVGKVVLDATISLDGFAKDNNVSAHIEIANTKKRRNMDENTIQNNR